MHVAERFWAADMRRDRLFIAVFLRQQQALLRALHRIGRVSDDLTGKFEGGG
jgi:hypothetical protein